jgi:hypothetical protein
MLGEKKLTCVVEDRNAGQRFSAYVVVTKTKKVRISRGDGRVRFASVLIRSTAGPAKVHDDFVMFDVSG